MRRVNAILLLFLLILPATIFALEVKEYKLENGLKVLIAETHKAPVATFQVWYRTGLRDEPAGKSGLSHLLEHMMFKGTARYGQTVFSKIIQKNGGTDNAYTMKDYTVYFEVFSSDRIMLAIDLEADRMQNLILDPKEVLSERSVVMEERRLRYEDDPQNSLFEEVVAAAYKVHPYQRPVIGWMSDLESTERDDLYNYYRANYSPSNAVIVIAGAKADLPPITPGVLNEKHITRVIKIDKDLTQATIILGHIGIKRNDPDYYAVSIMNYIFGGGGFSSRLMQSIRDKMGLAYDVNSFFSLNREKGVFQIEAQTRNESAGLVISEILKQMERIRKEQVSDEELSDAKSYLTGSFMRKLDTNRKMYSGLRENTSILKNYVLVVVANQKKTAHNIDRRDSAQNE